MKWTTQRGDERKAISVHDVGVQIKSRDKTTCRKTNDGEGEEVYFALIFGNKKLLRHAESRSKSPKGETK